VKSRLIVIPALAFSAILAPRIATAQADSANCEPSNTNYKARRALVATTFVAGNAALIAYEKKAWWSGQRAPHFFFRADWDQEFRDQDKFGHMFGGFHLARIGDALLRSACVSEPKAMMLAATYATLYQLQIEIWDGLYEKYGFSYADVIANTTGMTLAVAQHYHPALRVVKPTISYSPSAAMRNHANIPNSEIRPSLDYSGQTYWFSTDVNALLPESAKPYWPSILRFSVGHSITDWVDPVTGKSIRAKRKILLSIDLDADKLPGDNPIWKQVKRTISYIRLPAPALQLTPDGKFIGLYR
jgi:hypothetical protein